MTNMLIYESLETSLGFFFPLRQNYVESKAYLLSEIIMVQGSLMNLSKPQIPVTRESSVYHK